METPEHAVAGLQLRSSQSPRITRDIAPGVPRRGRLIPKLWAWAVCPTVFLFSYVPLLNLYARGVLASFLLWFAWSATMGRRRLIFPALPLWFIGWSLFALGVSLLAVDMNLAVRKWLTIVSVGGVAWAVSNAVVWAGSVRPWAWAYMLSAVAAYVCNYLPIESYVVGDYQTEVLGRYAGTLGNANAFGRAMVQAFFVGLALLHFHSRGYQAFFAILVMGVLGLATIESSSRTALLGLGVGVITFYGSIRIKHLITPLNVTGLCVVVGGIVAVFLYFPKHFVTSIERMKLFFSFLGLTPSIRTSEQSIDHRVELATRAFEVWQEHPVGVGLDNFRTYVGTYAHSNFLEILVSTGLIGLFIYYCPFIVFYVRELARRRQIDGQPWFLFCTGAIVAIGAMDTFNVSYYSKTFWLFVGILTGMSICRHRYDREIPESNTGVTDRKS